MLVKIRRAIKKKDNQKGFTLIELIVVMAILAVLAAIAIPRFAGTTDKAKVRADQASARTIVSAIQLGEADGTYTLSGAVITDTVADPDADVTSGIVANLVTRGYLAKAPEIQEKGSDSTGWVVTVASGQVSTIKANGATVWNQ